MKKIYVYVTKIAQINEYVVNFPHSILQLASRAIYGGIALNGSWK
jgi:hypothetical protein